MVLDTRVKRQAALRAGRPWMAVFPFPDGSADVTDRTLVGYGYSLVNPVLADEGHTWLLPYYNDTWLLPAEGEQMVSPRFDKDPDDQQPFTIDLSSWLKAGEVLNTTSTAWVLDPTFTAVGSISFSDSNTKVSIKLSGGVARPKPYWVTLRIVTDLRQTDASFPVYVKESTVQ